MSGPLAEDDDAAADWDFAAAREYQRIEREIVTRVRRGGRGKAAAVIADELRSQFAAALMPRPPEELRSLAEAITGYRWPAVHFLGQLTEIVVRRRVPSGLRCEEYRLPGNRWVPIQLVGTARARFALRGYRRIQGFSEQLTAPTMLTARLITIPGANGEEQVAAMLRSTFAGTLSPESASELIPTIEQAEQANRQLIVDARFNEDDCLLVLLPG